MPNFSWHSKQIFIKTYDTYGWAGVLLSNSNRAYIKSEKDENFEKVDIEESEYSRILANFHIIFDCVSARRIYQMNSTYLNTG